MALSRHDISSHDFCGSMPLSWAEYSITSRQSGAFRFSHSASNSSTDEKIDMTDSLNWDDEGLPC